jgi:hypothetical protein
LRMPDGGPAKGRGAGPREGTIGHAEVVRRRAQEGIDVESLWCGVGHGESSLAVNT